VKKKIVLITGGGTGGHVIPNIPIIKELQKRNIKVVYVGSRGGMESELVKGVEFYSIESGKFRRYLTFKNLLSPVKVCIGFLQVLKLIKKIKPGVIFSKGGYVSFPVVCAGWANGVPVVIHESDITPGLANKLALPFATKFCYSFLETKKFLPLKKSIWTGVPVREEIYKPTSSYSGKINKTKPTILVIGGSSGARVLNNIVRASLEKLVKKFQVIHICGKGGVVEGLSFSNYIQFEYLHDEFPYFLNLCDLVVSRAGATILYEILATKKPNLLVPLPKRASRGDQLLNASLFKKRGLSYVIEEENLTPETLIKGVEFVYSRRKKYKEKLATYQFPNATKIITQLLLNLCK